MILVSNYKINHDIISYNDLKLNNWTMSLGIQLLELQN